LTRLAARQTGAMGLSLASACSGNLLKSPSVARKRCLELGDVLPTTYGGINVPRLKLQGVCNPAHLLGGQDGRARAGELIEHCLALRGGVQQSVSDQRGGLCGRVGGERLHAAAGEGVHARISPDVGPVAAEPA
jgi:hypothetical protein